MPDPNQNIPPSDDDRNSENPVDETIDSDGSPDIEAGETRKHDGESSAIGQQIGPYRILEELGEGGMGSVYVAEQKEGVRRRVALKVIKAGLDSRQVIARFEAERQALAMMDHANIAKVFDVGTTETGQPFFAMELVQGKSITEFCDDHKLGIKKRLEIFRKVCNAVQHAHQKGIIHRDLKPSNILVTLQDDQPVPKVIDFGLAKATSQQLTEKTLFTAHGQVVGTLEYMSPEQANLNDLDVDTRSDIYSLGIILYELLTGSTPLTRESLRKAGFLEILKRIKEEEPERPSSRIVNSSDSLDSISSVRQIEPRRLSSLLKGELDWVVMRAIEKHRSKRYSTASELASEIKRFLNDEPVLARAPSILYRLSRLPRTKPALIVAQATSLFFTILIISFVAASIRLSQLDDQIRERAQRGANAIAISVKTSVWELNEAVIEEFLGASLTNEDIVYAEVTDKFTDKTDETRDWEKLAGRWQEGVPHLHLDAYKANATEYAVEFADVMHDGGKIGQVALVMSRHAIIKEVWRDVQRLISFALVVIIVTVANIVVVNGFYGRLTRKREKKK